MGTRSVELEACLVAMVRSSAMLMRALDAARAVDPPDWLIGSGVIRNLVWDCLHGFDLPTTPKDLDLVFFDSAALGEEREPEVPDALAAEAAEIPWDAKNQAAVSSEATGSHSTINRSLHPVSSIFSRVSRYPGVLGGYAR